MISNKTVTPVSRFWEYKGLIDIGGVSIEGIEMANGFKMKKVENYTKIKNSNRPIYQYDKKTKDFIRVYFVDTVMKGNELKLAFNEYYLFDGDFNFDRIKYRYINKKIFKEDSKKYSYYI